MRLTSTYLSFPDIPSDYEANLKVDNYETCLASYVISYC